MVGHSLLNDMNENGLSHKHTVKVVNKPEPASEKIFNELDDAIN